MASVRHRTTVYEANRKTSPDLIWRGAPHPFCWDVGHDGRVTTGLARYQKSRQFHQSPVITDNSRGRPSFTRFVTEGRDPPTLLFPCQVLKR